MKTPYEILGVPEWADPQTIKNAYRELAKKYGNESYMSGPLSEIARTKMEEINRAYDEIVQMRASEFRADSGTNTSYRNDYSYSYSASGLGDIRAKINSGRLDDAQVLLDGIPPNQRTAEWFFLKGTIHHRRGWLEEAYENYRRACEIDSGNPEYGAAYKNLHSSRKGTYRSARREKQGCSTCDICTALLCADCCCECMGGDLIKCC